MDVKRPNDKIRYYTDSLRMILKPVSNNLLNKVIIGFKGLKQGV
jgi:hypothetical protein